MRRMPSKFAELRRMVEAMTPGSGSTWEGTEEAYHAVLYAKLREEAPGLLDVREAAQRAVDAYWGAGNELAAMQDLRNALEKFGSQ